MSLYLRVRLLRISLAAAAAALIAPVGVAVEAFTIKGSEVRALPRSANGRDYTLYIGLPASYATSPTRKYPVLYACDGYWDFHLHMASTGNLAVDGAIPECIVVGFSYSGTSPDYGSLRNWDLTPGYDAIVGTNSGHAEDFLSVVANEFIPYVDSHYRTDTTYRVLAGSSFGGLFTTYALFERPGLFQAYIAVSPALWWRSRFILEREREFRSTHSELAARVYLTFAGDESSGIRDSTREFSTQLRLSGYSGLSVATREIEGERHSGTKADGYNRGLRFAFAPLAPYPSYVANRGLSSRSPLINLSSRARIGSGPDVLIAGFVVEGPDPKRVLVRGIGPELRNKGVNDAINDPKLTLFDAAHHVVATNDNWGSSADAGAIAQAAALVGAFPLSGASRDAAILITVEPGVYSAVVEGTDGAQGVGLVEVYEVLQ